MIAQESDGLSTFFKLQCGDGFSVAMVTVRRWLQCGDSYSVAMVTVRRWLQCGDGYSAVMVTVRRWLQCGDGYNAAMFTVWRMPHLRLTELSEEHGSDISGDLNGRE